MKKIFILSLLAAGILLLNSCSESLLDLNPTNKYTEDNFWKSETQADAGLAACYQTLRATGIYGGGGRLSPSTLKSYLGTCAAFASASSPELHAETPQLRSIIHEAPRLKGAWGKLLVAESDLVNVQSSAVSASRERRCSAAASPVRR
jgi:hypothetical protein